MFRPSKTARKKTSCPKRPNGHERVEQNVLCANSPQHGKPPGQREFQGSGGLACSSFCSGGLLTSASIATCDFQGNAR